MLLLILPTFNSKHAFLVFLRWASSIGTQLIVLWGWKMRLLIKAILITITTYSQLSISAETYTIEVCKTPLKNIFLHIKSDKFENRYHFWMRSSHSAHWSFEADDVEESGKAAIVANDAPAYLNTLASYDKTECEVVWQGLDTYEYRAKTSLIQIPFEHAARTYKYGIDDVSNDYVLFRNGEWVTRAALKIAGLMFPPKFEVSKVALSRISQSFTFSQENLVLSPLASPSIHAPALYTIEVCHKALQGFEKFSWMPQNIKHIWIQAKKDNEIIDLLSFEAGDDPETVALILANHDVPSFLRKTININSDVECREVLRTGDNNDFKEKWNLIEDEFKRNPFYNLYDNNCGMVAKKACQKAKLNFPYEHINTVPSKMVDSLEEAFASPKSDSIGKAVLETASVFLDIYGEPDAASAIGQFSSLFQ